MRLTHLVRFLLLLPLLTTGCKELGSRGAPTPPLVASQPAAGAVDVPLAIPSHPSFGGVMLFAQAMVLDGGAPSGVSMSRGFAVEFCR